MKKKGYNWRARNGGSETKIDNSTTKKIKINIEHREDKFDDCNALVLPSKKRKTEKKEKNITTSRLLSKKKRKELLKIVEKKEKKRTRAILESKLAEVAASQEELKKYISISSVQTKGRKRFLRELQESNTVNLFPLEDVDSQEDKRILNTLKGRKRKEYSHLDFSEERVSFSDPSVLDLRESSISGESSEGEVEEEEERGEKGEGREEGIKEVEEDGKEDEKGEIRRDCKEGKGKEEEKESKSVNVTEIMKKLPEVEVQGNENIKNIEKNNEKSRMKVERKPAYFVHLDRKSEIQEARLKLPILGEEQSIIEAINENDVVIITGETGSGKTTQVPQFLYEAGYTKNKIIGITEPRRVAAISMSKRVAEEMNLTEREVSYLIRFEGNTTSQTKIKFMTDGVLLKEIQTDFLLKKYSVIILDEAHERSIHTDILIGFLTRILSLRLKRKDPLKLIIMSATLRVDELINNTKLFKVKPPVINVETRQYPVTVHYNRITNANYVKDALLKVAKIHNQLPDGGILVFLTGQREVNFVVNKLRKVFQYKKAKFIIGKDSKKIEEEDKIDENDQDSESEFFNIKRRRRTRGKNRNNELPRVDLNAYSVVPADDTQGDLIDVAGDNDDGFEDYTDIENEFDDGIELERSNTRQPLWVLPLYSLLSSQKQARVFQPPPEGCRLCVVSTNVAETSLTIPNIKYVVDSGRCKMQFFDKITGVSTFKVTFASKAAANQRAGRAGRVSPGHCYRLYSSAVFNDQFPEFCEPEICRKPIDDLLLQLKAMHIYKVVNFPFPTNPGVEQLKAAEKRLCLLGALKEDNDIRGDSYTAKITDLGKCIATFPVAPRYGKILALSNQHNLFAYSICLVAAFSVQELLIDSFDTNSKLAQKRRFWAGTGNSLLLGDPMISLRSVGGAEYAALKGNFSKFCQDFGLREKTAIEVRKLRQQLTNEILLNLPDLNLKIDPEMPPPNDTQAKLLRQLILSGMVDHVARKLSSEEMKECEGGKKMKYAYKTLEMKDPVFMHSSSVLRKELPEWIVYQEIYETEETKKIYMRGVTAIDPEWLPTFAPDLCNMSEPSLDPPPWYNEESGEIMCYMTGTFGPGGWELPRVKLIHPNNIDGIKWFARFLLEGRIFPKFKHFAKHLLTTPTNINATWARVLPRVERIIKELLSKGVMSKDKLREVWSSDKKFLLDAYLMWLPQSISGHVVSDWPPL